MVEEKEGKLSLRVSPDLEIIHVTGGLGVTIDIDGIMIYPCQSRLKAGEIDAMREEPPTELLIKYLIMLPPHGAKVLVGALTSAVKEYEKTFGKIPMPPSEQKRKEE